MYLSKSFNSSVFTLGSSFFGQGPVLAPEAEEPVAPEAEEPVAPEAEEPEAELLMPEAEELEAELLAPEAAKPVAPEELPVAPLGLSLLVEPVGPVPVLEPVTPVLPPVAPVLAPVAPVLEPVAPVLAPVAPMSLCLEPVVTGPFAFLVPVIPLVGITVPVAPRLTLAFFLETFSFIATGKSLDIGKLRK